MDQDWSSQRPLIHCQGRGCSQRPMCTVHRHLCVSLKRFSQHILGTLTLNNQPAHVFRLDRVPTTAQDLGKGGIMIACAESLHPQEVNIHHHVQLEVKTISDCVSPPSATVHHFHGAPRQLSPYKQFPTVILGDFNDNISGLLSFMTNFLSACGFTQLVKSPTTDSGSLLDHIYYNRPATSPTVDVVDTYYSDHDATFISIPKNFGSAINL